MSQMMIDDEVDQLSDEQHLTAAFRAMRLYGIDCQWSPEGDIVIPDEVDVVELNGDDEFLAIHHEELKRIVVAAWFDQLTAEGKLKADHVDESGEIVYIAA